MVKTISKLISVRFLGVKLSKEHGSRRRGGQGGLGLPTFLLSKDFFKKIVKENIIIDKPFHPPNDYIFPKTKSGDRLRSCQAHWFKQFPWLHYDEK